MIVKTAYVRDRDDSKFCVKKASRQIKMMLPPVITLNFFAFSTPLLNALLTKSLMQQKNYFYRTVVALLFLSPL